MLWKNVVGIVLHFSNRPHTVRGINNSYRSGKTCLGNCIGVVERYDWDGGNSSGTLCCINCNVKNCISQSINFHKACTVSGVIVEKHAWDIALVLWKDMVGMVVTWVQLKFMVCTAHRPQY